MESVVSTNDEENQISDELTSDNTINLHDIELKEKYNDQLRTRINDLREVINSLKEQLTEEKERWQKEIDYKNEYLNRIDCNFLHRASEMSFHDSSYFQSQYDSRQNLQKQIAMSNYRRRLLEVENMCNLELLRVKQQVQYLQPLQHIVSEWNIGDNEFKIQNGQQKEENIVIGTNGQIEVTVENNMNNGGHGDNGKMKTSVEVSQKHSSEQNSAQSHSSEEESYSVMCLK